MSPGALVSSTDRLQRSGPYILINWVFQETLAAAQKSLDISGVHPLLPISATVQHTHKKWRDVSFTDVALFNELLPFTPGRYSLLYIKYCRYHYERSVRIQCLEYLID